jgi:putative transposase
MIGCYIIEPDDKEILGISISKERKNMFVVAEHFLSDVVDDYGSHPVSPDGGSWNQYKHVNSCR